MGKNRVSITICKTWKGSRHYTPSHTPSLTVWRIYALIKKAISTFLFSAGYFIKEMENIFFRVLIRYRNTLGSLGELEIAWKHSPCGLVLPLQFLVLPNFHSCFYNCMETWKCFLFLKWITLENSTYNIYLNLI